MVLLFFKRDVRVFLLFSTREIEGGVGFLYLDSKWVNEMESELSYGLK
jgi:hypothetical protein